MKDILLATEYEVRCLAGSILMVKTLSFQAKYMGTQKTKVTVHRVPAHITEDRMRFFFARYGQVEDTSAIINKAGIVLHLTMTHKSF